MAATFTTTQAGASADYITYLLDQAEKVDRNGSPTLLNFELSPNDVGFVRLTRGAYITLDTTVYPKWFTGYVTNDPEYQYLGTKGGVPTWGYKYFATDDSYILSLKPIGLLPPFINSKAGQIIKSLVKTLDTSALFDVTNIADGPLIARYIVDPNKKFQDVITDLCKISAFRFVANDHKLYFEANDTTTATIAVDGATANQHFTPSSLNIRPTTDPIVNDAIVVGAPEPQDYIKEWWVGDGFTGEFPLLSGLYGGDSSLLLQDDFSGATIDTTNWNIYDALGNLTLASGYLNVLGGNATGAFDIHLDSALVLPLESVLRLTHGVWDFVSTGTQAVAGFIGGLWTQAPNAAKTGCVYALNVAKVGAALVLSPIVNGTVDGTQTFTVDFTKRYVLRTLCNFSRTHRQDTTYSYLAANGSTGSYGGSAVADTVTYSTWITEFDPVTAAITRQAQLVNSNVTIGNTVAFANYIPVADNDLHATLMGITISVPMQGALYIQPAGVYDPTKFVPKLLGVNEIDALDGLAPIATITSNGSGVQGQTNGLGTPRFNPGDAKLAFFKDSIHLISYIPNPGDIINLAYRRAGLSVGRVQNAASIALEATSWGDDGIRSLTRNDISPAPRTSRECRLAAGAIVQDSGFQHFEGDYSQYSLFEFIGEPQSGTVLKFNNLPAIFPSYLQAELISEVDTTLFLRRPQEFFLHKVSFGKPDALSKALARFYRAENQINFGLNTDAVDTPDATQLADVALADIPDVATISLDAYDPTSFYFNTNVAAPASGGFEVRLTDQSWGANDAKNLVSRVTSGTVFTLPRIRVATGFVEAYTASHAAMSRYPSGVRVSFPSIPAGPTAITYDAKSLALVPTLPAVQRDIYGAEFYQIVGTGVVDSSAFTLVSDGADVRNAVVYGVDATGALMTEVITLNGTTPVGPVGTYAGLAAVQFALKDSARTVTIKNGGGATIGTIGPNAWHAEIGLLAYQVRDILLATALQNDPELSYVIGTKPPPGAMYSAFFFNMLDERSTPAVIEPVAVIPPEALAGTECLDVRSFGAVGDGVTDDTAAVQAALDEAAANYAGITAALAAGTSTAAFGPTKVCIPSGVICLVVPTWDDQRDRTGQLEVGGVMKGELRYNSTSAAHGAGPLRRVSYQGNLPLADYAGPIIYLSTWNLGMAALLIDTGVTLQIDGGIVLGRSSSAELFMWENFYTIVYAIQNKNALIQGPFAGATNHDTGFPTAKSYQEYISGSSKQFPVADAFTGDGSTTVFTLSQTPLTAPTVTVNGTTKSSPGDYTISGTTLTFTVAPAAAALIGVNYITLDPGFELGPRNNNILITGTGFIDCGADAYRTYPTAALRTYSACTGICLCKCDQSEVNNLTIKKFSPAAVYWGHSEQVKIQNLILQDSHEYAQGDNEYGAIVCDVLRKGAVFQNFATDLSSSFVQLALCHSIDVTHNKLMRSGSGIWNFVEVYPQSLLLNWTLKEEFATDCNISMNSFVYNRAKPWKASTLYEANEVTVPNDAYTKPIAPGLTGYADYYNQWNALFNASGYSGASGYIGGGISGSTEPTWNNAAPANITESFSVVDEFLGTGGDVEAPANGGGAIKYFNTFFSVLSGLVVKVNGVTKTLTTDYTVSGSRITFVSALTTSDVVTASYNGALVWQPGSNLPETGAAYILGVLYARSGEYNATQPAVVTNWNLKGVVFNNNIITDNDGTDGVLFNGLSHSSISFNKFARIAGYAIRERFQPVTGSPFTNPCVAVQIIGNDIETYPANLTPAQSLSLAADDTGIITNLVTVGA